MGFESEPFSVQEALWFLALFLVRERYLVYFSTVKIARRLRDWFFAKKPFIISLIGRHVSSLLFVLLAVSTRYTISLETWIVLD